MSKQQHTLMRFDPATGREMPYPSHAQQWREFNGKHAWLLNPWTGERRSSGDVGDDPFGLLILPPGEPVYAAPRVVAYEFLHPNGHAIVDYSEHTHVGHLSAQKGYAARPLVYGPRPACLVCGTPHEKHGSYPTCASHPYTPDGSCQHVIGAKCAGEECRNGCVQGLSVKNALPVGRRFSSASAGGKAQ